MRLLMAIIWLTSPVFLAVGQEAGRPTAKELVQKLASPRFAERAAAEKKLLQLGPAALPAVRDGLKLGDAEARFRCERILGRIEEEQWRRQIDAYAADLKGEKRYDFPLQDAYEKMAGTGPAARKLFAACLRRNGPLLQKAAGDRARGLEAYKVRCWALYVSLNSERDPLKADAADLATLLLISAAGKYGEADWAKTESVENLFGNPGLREAVRDREIGKVVGRLLVAWAKTREAAHFRSRQYFIYFVQADEFKEGLAVLRRWIRDKDIVTGHFLAMTVFVLRKVGGKDAAADLEKLWEDKTVLFTRPLKPPGEARLGDQALAASMRLAGKDPKVYGLAELVLPILAPGSRFWEAQAYGFASNEDRQAALKKWKSGAGKRK